MISVYLNINSSAGGSAPGTLNNIYGDVASEGKPQHMMMLQLDDEDMQRFWRNIPAQKTLLDGHPSHNEL